MLAGNVLGKTRTVSVAIAAETEREIRCSGILGCDYCTYFFFYSGIDQYCIRKRNEKQTVDIKNKWFAHKYKQSIKNTELYIMEAVMCGHKRIAGYFMGGTQIKKKFEIIFYRSILSHKGRKKKFILKYERAANKFRFQIGTL